MEDRERLGGLQNHNAHADGGLGELAFALCATIECRATFQLVIFVFCLAVADSCVCVYCYADKRRKPQDCKQDIENGKGVWICEALRSLKCRYRCLVDEDWYTEPALRTISCLKSQWRLGAHQCEEVFCSAVARAFFHQNCNGQCPAKEDDEPLESVESILALVQVVVG